MTITVTFPTRAAYEAAVASLRDAADGADRDAHGAPPLAALDLRDALAALERPEVGS